MFLFILMPSLASRESHHELEDVWWRRKRRRGQSCLDGLVISGLIVTMEEWYGLTVLYYSRSTISVILKNNLGSGVLSCGDCALAEQVCLVGRF